MIYSIEYNKYHAALRALISGRWILTIIPLSQSGAPNGIQMVSNAD